MLGRLWKDRSNSCPDIVQQSHRDFDNLSNSNWRYTTAHKQVCRDPYYLRLRNDQQTQTDATHTLHVKDMGAQYSSPSDDSDSSISDFDSDIEGTENITVAKHFDILSHQRIYTQILRRHISDSGLQLLILLMGDHKRNQ